jgi:hypothetical protein
MDVPALIDRLEINTGALQRLFAGVSREQAAWKPAPDRWSIVEVAAHLLDEEREDFRARLRLMLESPGDEWPPIDPPGWVTSRRYGERELSDTVIAFVEERARSISWLRSLADPDWGRAHQHPSLGTLRAGDLLVSWVAHDALHARQLAGLHWAYLRRLGAPFSPAYAGDW